MFLPVACVGIVTWGKMIVLGATQLLRLRVVLSLLGHKLEDASVLRHKHGDQQADLLQPE